MHRKLVSITTLKKIKTIFTNKDQTVRKNSENVLNFACFPCFPCFIKSSMKNQIQKTMHKTPYD